MFNTHNPDEGSDIVRGSSCVVESIVFEVVQFGLEVSFERVRVLELLILALVR